MSKLGIRYTEDGDVESYDLKTGKTVGHITTMGNYIEETKEERDRKKRQVETIKKEFLRTGDLYQIKTKR